MSHRLLLITETYPPDRGGMSESCDRIVRGLARSGVSVDLAHFDRRVTHPVFRTTSFGSELHFPLETDAAHTINCLWNRVQQTVDLTQTTHVVAFGGNLPLLAAPVFAAWISRPLITLLRGNEFDAGLFDARRRGVLDEALKRSAMIGTVTSAQAAKVAALHPEASVRSIANGIDLDLWFTTDADIQRGREFRARHIEEGRRVFGMFGHLKAKKGVPFFIDSIGRSGLADRVHLLLIGEMEDRIIAPTHTRLPSMDRFGLLPYYAASDLVVLPSHYDGFPNVLIEAMTLGRPLIASSVGGMADVLVDGETAFLFPPGDENGCADAIARAVDASDETLRVMGGRCREVASTRCDARDETHRYLQILEQTSGEQKLCADLSSSSAPL